VIAEPRERAIFPAVGKADKPNVGLVNWLLSCPDKDYFVPVDAEPDPTKCASEKVAPTRRGTPAVHPVDRAYGLIDIGQPVDDAIVAMRGALPQSRRRKRRST
jgi:hypothetical protein